MTSPSILNVIDNSFCCGCGACSTLSDDISMKLNEYGYFEVILDKKARNDLELMNMASKVCPFSDESIDETEIGGLIYDDAPQKSTYIGNYINSYIGYVNEGEFRSKGSSGGIGKWIACELFKQGEVDSVIQVKMNERYSQTAPLYEYGVFDSYESIAEGSKSAYYPVEMSSVIAHIKNVPGKYVVTGVHCFIKAIRLLQEEDPVLKERIRYTIGVICGHLKSKCYAEMIGWQLGVKPNDLMSLDFRKKSKDLMRKKKVLKQGV